MAIRTSDYDYVLPDSLIANSPPAERGTTRLLVLDKTTGATEDKMYADVVEHVTAGDVVVLNDTKVIPARLQVQKKANGVKRELILLEQHGRDVDWHNHRVLYRRSLSVGDTLITPNGVEIYVNEILEGGIATVSSKSDLLELALTDGSVPLPPYMHRDATPADVERYQTVWAKQAGSVAAPTASLNMTETILDTLRAKGAIICYLTLHVGLGTFLPIRADDLTEHTMHQEYFEIPKQTLAAIRTAKQTGNKIVAVGTTVTRTLEYAADNILYSTETELTGEADIFMYPGYEFKLVDILLTNFHAPRSTVLMLAAAFAGWNNLRAAYEHAVAENYNFLSYGDSMLIH